MNAARSPICALRKECSLVNCTADFGIQPLKAPRRLSCIVYKIRQCRREYILACQLAHFDERDEVRRGHLSFLDLKREAVTADIVIEELFKGLALNVDHCWVVCMKGYPMFLLVDGVCRRTYHGAGYDWQIA